MRLGNRRRRVGPLSMGNMTFWELSLSRLPIWQTSISELSLWGRRSGRHLPSHGA
jgi:hypothetical protein